MQIYLARKVAESDAAARLLRGRDTGVKLRIRVIETEVRVVGLRDTRTGHRVL